MEAGSIADWVGAVGGLLAVCAAVIAWQVSERLLKVEQKRDRDAEMRVHREQAELVFVLGARLPSRPEDERWGLYLVNAASKPIYDLCIESAKLGGSPNPSLSLGALPPGKFVVPSHPKYHWGALIDLERTPEPVDLLVKGKGNRMVECVTFADAARATWKLVGGTELHEVPK